VATGSVARRYQPRSDLPTKKRKAVTKSAGEGMTNVEDSSVEQESQSAVPRSRNNDASSLTEEHEREEIDDGSEADAEFEWEEDEKGGYALSGRQQNSRHAVPAHTEGETINDNPYAFGQDNLRNGNRSLDGGNSSQGRNRDIRPALSSPHPSTAANTYGSGLLTPFGAEVSHQFAATASNPTLPANDTLGGAIPGAGHLQHGMGTLGNPAYKTQVPSDVLSNTVDQPTLGA
jgi:hypothetical protein